MTTEEQKALELAMLPIKDVPINAGTVSLLQTYVLDMNDAKQAAIEAHEADRKAFSAAMRVVQEYLSGSGSACLGITLPDGREVRFADFIPPKPEPGPDPLVEALCAAISDLGQGDFVSHETLGKALAARGYKIERIDNG